MDVILETTIKCPNCGEEEMVMMPTDRCIRRFECNNCNLVLEPKDDDCCVFCSYAETKCPSKQNDKDRGDDLNLEV